MSEAVYRTIGRNIKRERNRAGMTQEALSRRIGMTRANLANTEAGRTRIPIHRLYDIAEAVGCEVAPLLEGMRGAMPSGTEVASRIMALHGRRFTDPAHESRILAEHSEHERRVVEEANGGGA